MAKLGIDLQDGFEGDDVVVKINGQEVMRRGDVSTKRILGLAGSHRAEVGNGPVTIEVSVPSRRIEHRLEVDASNDVYVGLSLVNGRLEPIIRKKPFGYG
jgi:hypothetical protein